jgi:outer membrane protein assembly factor BamB
MNMGFVKVIIEVKGYDHRMKAIRAFIVLAAAGLVLTASPMAEISREDWPTFRGNFGRTGRSASGAPRSPALRWSVRIPGAGDIWSSPSVSDGRLYIGGISGSLYCLESDTGNLLWEFHTGTGQPVFSSPTVAGASVYFAGHRMLYALPREDPDGDGLISSREAFWRYTFGPSTGDVNDVNCASPALAGGILCVGSVDQYFYGIDAANGRLRWSNFTVYRGQHAFSSSPAVLGDRVFTATGNQSGSGRIYCFNKNSGAIEWEFDNDDITFSTPAAENGRVYAGNSGDWAGGNAVHRFFCLDADGMEDHTDDGVKDGHEGGSDLVWSVDLGSYAFSSPALSGGRLFIGCSDGRLLCLDAATGSGIWVHNTPPVGLIPPMGIMGSPAIADGTVFVGTADGRLIAVPETDPDGDGTISDSELVWSFPVGGLLVSSPAIADGRIYIAGNGGRILCIGE